jgi:hypothetical protein
MAFDIRENSGSLFANEDRLTDNSPNASGRCRIGGKLYRISSWTKTSGAGTKFMSLAFQLDAKQEIRDAENEMAKPPFDDNIPFVLAMVSLLPFAAMVAGHVA